MLAVLFAWTARYESIAAGSGGPDTSPRCSPPCACPAAMLAHADSHHNGAADLQKLAPIDFPATRDTGVVHDRISSPSARTEQHPHWPSPQPNRGPFSARSSVSTYRSGVAGS